MSAPAFLNKPKHKDLVVATSRGWVVEKTGELLVSVKNLDQRIAEHLGLPSFYFEKPTESVHDDIGVEVPKINDAIEDEGIPSNVSIDKLLDTLDLATKETVVAPVVAVELPAPVVVDAPVVEKPRRGRPPKVRDPVVEAPVVEVAPVVAEEATSVMEA